MFPEFRLEFFFFMCLYSLIVAITSIATAKVQAILVEEYVTWFVLNLYSIYPGSSKVNYN